MRIKGTNERTSYKTDFTDIAILLDKVDHDIDWLFYRMNEKYSGNWWVHLLWAQFTKCFASEFCRIYLKQTSWVIFLKLSHNLLPRNSNEV